MALTSNMSSKVYILEIDRFLELPTFENFGPMVFVCKVGGTIFYKFRGVY